jgi:hypothetical protein
MILQSQQPFVDDVFLGMDLDLGNIDNTEVNWNGWDDMVRDFQIDAEGRGKEGDMGLNPAIGGMANWW